MSGLNNNRTRFSNNTVSNINNVKNINSNPVKMVDFSTVNIENSSVEIQDKISELIEKRSNILMYVNDLYKGYVNLSESSAQAINAYLNIIKDNTAFLNQNKGIIVNQLSQANKLIFSDENSA